MGFRKAPELDHTLLGARPEASRSGRFAVSEAQRRAVVEAEARFSGRVTEEDKKATGLVQDARARYKVEVTFGPRRTTLGPNAVNIQVWESGKRLHGGGDELAFFCRSSEGPEGCGGVITGDCIKNGVAMCPHCQRAIRASALSNAKIGRPSTQTLALTLVKMFHELGASCDIYLKYHPTDIRYVAMQRDKGVAVARRLKGMHIYPLARILTDTAHGASLEKRFFAFLTS